MTTRIACVKAILFLFLLEVASYKEKRREMERRIFNWLQVAINKDLVGQTPVEA